MTVPRSDEERTSLLRDGDRENGDAHAAPKSFAQHLGDALREPLTPLTILLLVACLAFLLLSSVFIGLFAGTKHNLNLEKGRKGGEDHTVTSTYTTTGTTVVTSLSSTLSTKTEFSTIFTGTTSTATEVSTSTYTTTSVSTKLSTTTSIATETETQTRTKTFPGPVPAPTSTNTPDGPVSCVSADCIMLSAAVLSNLDTSADPCNSFYDFANGGWVKTHPIPSDKGSVANFGLLADENRQIIKRFLEGKVETASESESSHDHEILKKLRGLYGSCMDEKELNKRGIKPLLELAEEIQTLYRHGPERVAGDLMDRRGLTAAMAYLHSRGIEALFNFYFDGDVGENPDMMTLWFSQPTLGLPTKEYYEEKEITKLYQEVLEKLLTIIYEAEEEEEEERERLSTFSRFFKKPVFRVLEETTWPPWPWPPWGGDDEPKTPSERAMQHSKKIVELERSLAQASLDLDILYGDPYATYNPVTVRNLSQTISQVHFETYFTAFAPRNYPQKIIVTSYKYAEYLGRLLDDTPAQITEAYLVARAALQLSPHLGLETEAWKAQRTLVEALQGIKKGAIGDRGEYCVERVEEAMGFAAGRYFANETFGGDSRERGEKVIFDIIKSFKDSLGKIEWMDGESAEAAKKKADNIRVKVGYPLSPNTTSAASIAKYYLPVKIKRDKFFENMLSAAINDKTKAWGKLGKTRDLQEWEMYPSTVNAYFSPPANEIVFPAGIMRPPFFNRAWPAYMNYGGFGMVASHELTHAFDSSGRLYNENGKLEEWWTKETSEGFDERQQCISKQYSKYTIDDGKGGKAHVNGELQVTSTENIGDSGLIQAFRAWKAQFDEEKNDYLLPGLDYTREQLFFIAFGRIWATNMRPEAAMARLRSDPHSPARWRVDGTLRNIPEFSEAFDCPKGSPMNPKQSHRCLLW